MDAWLQLAIVGVCVLLLASALHVKRYSRQHVEIRLTVAGRGLYFSRTPDGIWCKLRLRRHAPRCCLPEPGDQPPDIGVREPRNPRGDGPVRSVGLERAVRIGDRVLDAQLVSLDELRAGGPAAS